MRFIFLVATGVFALSGCATTPVPSTLAKPAPAERLLAFQEKTNGPSGVLTVTRDAGLLGGGCFYMISINGTIAARLDTGERSTFYIPPGEITLRAGRDSYGKALCSLDQSEWTQRETQLKAGETKYFRMSIDANGKTDIQRTDE